MAQIIKHRRGSIGNLKAATSNNAELVVASGSISNLSGPFVFIGSPTPGDNGSAGAFRPVSKIYTGASAPTISNLTYGTVLDGTPFYSTGNQSLYILNNDGVGNTRLDLTGNLENKSISNIQIDTLSGSVEVLGDITGSNLSLSGDANIVGNIILGGNITLGDQDIDFVQFKADVSSSIIPDAGSTYDLGSPSKTWANVYTDSISVTNIDLGGNIVISGSLTVSQSVQFEDTLDVDGQTTLASVNVEDLTDNRVVIVGASGELEDDINFTYDGTTLTVGNFTVNQSTGNVNTAGTLSVSGSAEISGALQVNSSLDVNGQGTFVSLNVEDLNNDRIVIAGSTGELEDDPNLTYDGTTLTVGQLTVAQGTGNINTPGTLTVGGTTNLNGDVFISGSLTLLESATSLIVSSSTVELDDNIIRLNAFAPFERYAGFEVIDSGSSGISASLLWDSQNDYWLIQSSSQETGKVISTTYSTFGSEVSLTTNTIPKATGNSSIGNSLLTDSGTALVYDTDALTVNATTGNTNIKGTVTLPNAGGSDAGSDSSNIVYRNSSNILGYIPSTDTTSVMDQILGYRSSDGQLVFSSVIDGGTF